MRIQPKLLCGAGVVVVFMFASALIGNLQMTRVVRVAHELDRDRGPFLESLQDLHTDLAKEMIAVQLSILLRLRESNSTGPRVESKEWKAVESDMRLLQHDSSRFDLGLDRRKMDDLADRIEAMHRLLTQVADLQTGNPDSATSALGLVEAGLLPLNARVQAEIDEIAGSQRRISEAEGASLYRADAHVIWTLWVSTIVGATIALIAFTLLGRHIARSIDLVAARAHSIAAGDLTGGGLKIGSDDQLGKLAAAMQQMQATLAGVIGTVVATAGSLTARAASMRNAGDQIHRRIDEQTQQTQQAATAMQEMSASIAEVSRHTQSAAETARSAAETAREGGAIVKHMLGTMHSIAGAVSETSATVGLLGEDSKRISQIVTVIDEIARKTNLLALNAAIEAARAGDQGRGFAVVAGEVRRLAESTAKATGEIGAMIHEIQERTRTAIANMASGTGTVQQGVVTTKQAGVALERIIGMAERVDRMIAQIAIGTSQQAAAADQSSASLDSIHTLSHENLIAIAGTAAGIESLRGTAAALEEQVDRFHLRAEARARPV